MLEFLGTIAGLALGLTILGAALGRRIVRLESRIEETPRRGAVRELGDRLEAMERRLAGLDPAGERRALEEVRRELRELASALGNLRPAGGEPGVRERVRSRLRQDGYEAIRFLGESPPPGAGAGRPVRVPVEATRAGMRYKGHVLVRPEGAWESRLRPIHGVFP